MVETTTGQAKNNAGQTHERIKEIHPEVSPKWRNYRFDATPAFPLPSARKAGVDEDPVHFGVARTKVAHIPSCMPGVLACDCLHDINHADFRRCLIGLPDPSDIPAQQCCKLSGHIVS